MEFIVRCLPVRNVSCGEIEFENGLTIENPIRLDVSAKTMNEIIEGFLDAYDIKEDENKIYTMKEAAKFLNLSLNTLRNLDKNQKLVPIRTEGGRRRYYLKQLQEYLESRKQAKGTQKKTK